MLYRLKSLVPEAWKRPYHYALARLAALWYGNPSQKLIVIGVTGTNGKTTTTYLTAKALEASGFKTGCTTTAIMKVGDQEWLNKTKMTMPGRFFLQRTLRQMVNAGCRYAVIETSSQGLIQYRHVGINYDVAVFTNLTPEHLEAHGGFEAYKRAKLRLFEHVNRSPIKTVDGKRVQKQVILNAGSQYAEEFAQAAPSARISWYGMDSSRGLSASDIRLDASGSSFSVEGISTSIRLPGRYNVENALASLATCQALGVDVHAAAEKIASVERVPGRFEKVEAGQPWSVIVDYAPEPESFQRLYEALTLVPHERIIHVLGSCGGGRDVARRPVLGQLAGEKADIVIVTNEDPYDDDPNLIIDQVASGAVAAGKRDGETLFRVTDRREAIFKAMELARAGDLVVLTGKGCEPWICLAQGRKIPWDEVAVAREAIVAAQSAVPVSST